MAVDDWAPVTAAAGDDWQPVAAPRKAVEVPDRIPQAMEDRLAAGDEARKREGGLLQTIPQGIEMMSTPEGRTRLWEAVKKYPSKLLDDTVNMAKLPGDVMSGKVDLSTEEGLDQAIGLGMLIAGSRLSKLPTTGKTSGMAVSMGEPVSRISKGPMGEIYDLPIGTAARSEDFVAAAEIVGGSRPQAGLKLVEAPEGGIYEPSQFRPGEKYFKALDADGNVSAEMLVKIDGKTARIEDIINPNEIREDGIGTIGNAQLRGLIRQFRTQYPEVTEFTGKRVSGARMDGKYSLIEDPTEVSVPLSRFGGEAPMYIQEKLLAAYEEKGLHPSEVAHDAQSDPVVAQQLLSSDKGVLPPGEPPPRPPEPPKPPAEPPAPPPEGSFEAAQKTILDKISIGESAPKEGLTWAKLYRWAIDDLHPLKGVDEDAYQLARLTRGQFGKAEHFIEHGTFDFNTYKTNGKPLAEILDPVSKDLDGFRAYLASKRALELDLNSPRVKNPYGATVEDNGASAIIRTPNQEGTLSLQVKDDAVHVGVASVGKADRGKGMAVSMYEEAARFAASKGVPLRSDISVSPAAARVYEALKKRGYDVKLEPNARKLDNGAYIAADSRNGYVFEVRPTEDVIGQKSGMNLTAAQRVAADGEGKYADAARGLQSYQENLLAYLRDSGVISGDAFTAMREAGQNYVPFYRVFEAESGTGAGKSFGPGSPIKKLKGSERDIVDPLESIIKNTYAFISVAERNAVGIKLIDALKEQGEKVTTGKLPRDAELVDYLKEQGVTEPEKLADFVQSAAREDGDTLSAWRDGKREQVNVKDPELVAAFRGLDQQSADMLTRVLAAPAKLLRAGATLSPDFIVRNIVRDFMTAFVNSGSALFSPIDTAKGLVGVIRKDVDFQNWMKGGGANATMVSLDRRYLQESLQKLNGETGLMERGWNVITSPVRGLRLVSELAENATRLGEFKKLTGEGKADIQSAAYASREVTLDFARIGASMRAYNMITAFGNAQIQGLDRIGRAFVDRPINTTAKVAGGITLPSVLLWWANHDDPRYQELPHWQKDMFWIVMTKDHVFRIPKPFELGVVFGSGVERILDATVGQNKEAFDGLGKSIAQVIMPNYIPTAAQPLAEQWANRSSMSDRTLIPADMEKFLPEYQYTPYTTEIAKKLGQVVSAFPGMRSTAVGPGAPFGPMARAVSSPILLENYVRSWTGGLGVYAMQAADASLRKAGVLPDPVTPTPTLADIPVVKAFMVRYPSASTQSIQDFYDQHETTKRYYDTWLSKAKEGDTDAMARIQAAGGPIMFVRLDAIKETLSDHSKLVRDIYKNPTIGAPEKRQLIDGLYFNMIQIGKAGKKMLTDSETALRRSTETAP